MAEQQQVELDTDGFEEQEVQVAESKPEIEDEKIESVDMLRVLESGGQVRMVPTTFPTIGVDTPKHLEMVIDLMRSDELMKTYLS